MTGPPSSSYPGQVPSPAAVVSPENEEKSSGFDRKFAGFVLRRPAAIFGDQVFKYDPPNDTTRPHSVYLFQNPWSFMKCDLSQAKMVGKPTQGGGEGFEFVLKRWQPYYFACGEHNGLHCKDGLMRFVVFPMFRGWHY